MSKEIQLIDVSIEDVPTAKGGYKAMSVAFKDLSSGKVDAKKLVSFSADKGVWETLAKAAKGDTFSVDTEKDENLVVVPEHIRRKHVPDIVTTEKSNIRLPTKSYLGRKLRSSAVGLGV